MASKEEELAIKIAGKIDPSFSRAMQGASKQMSAFAKSSYQPSSLLGKGFVSAQGKVRGFTDEFKRLKSIYNGGEFEIKGLWAGLTRLGDEGVFKDAGKAIGTGLLHGADKAITGFEQVTKAAAVGSVAALGAVGAGAVALGKQAMDVGKEFESSMSQVAATMMIDKYSEDGAAQYAMLEEAARKMGRETAFSAGEAAEALNYLAMAGYSAEDAAKALPTVLNMAGAGGLELAESANMIAASMASLGIEKTEENMSHFADIVAITASRAKTDVSGLGEAITTVGSTAAGLKGGTEEVAAALGILADIDLTGSEGGTHLRNMILALQNPRNKDAAAMMERLGVNAYDSQGKMRGLNEIFADLNNSMEGMTDQARNDVIATIFKQTDLAAAGAMLENCTDRFNELYEAAANSSEGNGAAAEMYSRQLDNLEGDISILKSGLSDLGISFYKDVGGPAREVTKYATQMVSQLSEAYGEGGLAGMVGSVGTVLGQAGADFAAKAPELVNVGMNMIGNFVQGIQQNAPMIAQNAAVAVGSFIAGALQLIPQIMLTGVDLIVNFVGGIIPMLPTIVSAATQAVLSWVTGIVDRLPWILQTGIQLVMGLASSIFDNLDTIVSTGIEAAANLVKGIFTIDWLDVGWQIIQAIGKGIFNIGKGIFEGIGKVISGGSAPAEFEETGTEVGKSFTEGASVELAKTSQVASNTFGEMSTSFDLSLATMQTSNLAAYQQINTDMNTEMSSAMDIMKGNVGTAMTEMGDDTVAQAQATANQVKAIFENMEINIPAANMPTATVVPGAAGQAPQVTWNAAGGIFTKPTIFGGGDNLQGVGEAGAEAVLPLDTLWSKMREIVQDSMVSAGSAVDALIGSIQGVAGDAGMGFGGGGPAQITYSPENHYHFEGGAPDMDAISGASDLDYEKFEAFMERLLKHGRMRQFAGAFA